MFGPQRLDYKTLWLCLEWGIKQWSPIWNSISGCDFRSLVRRTALSGCDIQGVWNCGCDMFLQQKFFSVGVSFAEHEHTVSRCIRWELHNRNSCLSGGHIGAVPPGIQTGSTRWNLLKSLSIVLKNTARCEQVFVFDALSLQGASQESKEVHENVEPAFNSVLTLATGENPQDTEKSDHHNCPKKPYVVRMMCHFSIQIKSYVSTNGCVWIFLRLLTEHDYFYTDCAAVAVSSLVVALSRCLYAEHVAKNDPCPCPSNTTTTWLTSSLSMSLDTGQFAEPGTNDKNNCLKGNMWPGLVS